MTDCKHNTKTMAMVKIKKATLLIKKILEPTE
jgi:hypothetical protein